MIFIQDWGFLFPDLERKKEIRPSVKIGFWPSIYSEGKRAEGKVLKFCKGSVVRDVVSEHGKQNRKKGGAVRKPTHKAFDAKNLHQHPRNCAENHSFRFEDRNQARS